MKHAACVRRNVVWTGVLQLDIVGDNMKLYMQSYRDISNVLLNLDKIKKSQESKSPNSVTNNTLVIQEPKSTADLIKELGSLKTD